MPDTDYRCCHLCGQYVCFRLVVKDAKLPTASIVLEQSQRSDAMGVKQWGPPELTLEAHKKLLEMLLLRALTGK